MHVVFNYSYICIRRYVLIIKRQIKTIRYFFCIISGKFTMTYNLVLCILLFQKNILTCIHVIKYLLYLNIQ